MQVACTDFMGSGVLHEHAVSAQQHCGDAGQSVGLFACAVLALVSLLVQSLPDIPRLVHKTRA